MKKTNESVLDFRRHILLLHRTRLATNDSMVDRRRENIGRLETGSGYW
jgi:hypothetical protein